MDDETTEVETTGTNPEDLMAEQDGSAQESKAAPKNQASSQAPTKSGGPIQLSDADYQRLLAAQNERDQLAAERRAAEAQAESDRLKLLAEKGQYEEALRQHQKRSEEEIKKAVVEREQIQQRYLDRERSLAVNDATAGASFANEFAARQARQILESKFDVVVNPATNTAEVVDKVTRRPAADVAREWLAGPEAAHFLAPKGKGGSPSSPGNSQTDGGDATADEGALTFEQRTMKAWREMQRSRAGDGWQLGVVQQARSRTAETRD